MNDNRQMMTERASSEPGERTGSRRRPARSIGLIVLTVTATALVLTQLAYDNLRTRGWTTYVSANDIGLGSHDLIPGFDLQALAVDSLNRVWVGSNEGLNMLSPNGEWANYTTTNSGLAESTIQTLAIDEKGQVWVGTTWGGLSVLASNSTWKSYTKANSGLVSNYVNALAIDTQGQVWVATDNELSVLAADGSWDTIDVVANAITVDRQGRVWIGTKTSVMVKDTEGIWRTYDISSSGLRAEHDYYTEVVALAVDGQGRAWVGTRKGLARVDLNGDWKMYTDSNPDFAREFYDFVEALAVDSQDQLWVGTDRGLSMMRSDGTWTTYSSANSGLAKGGIFALAIDAEGRIWIRAEHGLSVLDISETVAPRETEAPSESVAREVVEVFATLRGILIAALAGAVLYLLFLYFKYSAPRWFRWGLTGAISGAFVMLFIALMLLPLMGAGSTGWTGGMEYLILGFFCGIGLVGGFLVGVVVQSRR